MSVHTMRDRFGPSYDSAAAARQHVEWVEASSDLLDELEEMLSKRRLFSFLDFAAGAVTEVGSGLDDYLSELRRSGLYEAAMFATAMDWMARGVQPDSVLDPDTPAWLVGLDQGQIVQAEVCLDRGETTSYLIGMRVGGRAGTIQATIDHTRSDALATCVVVGGPIAKLKRELAAATAGDKPRYVRTGTETAVYAVARAIARFDDLRLPRDPADPWPRNRPLVTFAMSQFELAEPC